MSINDVYPIIQIPARIIKGYSQKPSFEEFLEISNLSKPAFPEPLYEPTIPSKIRYAKEHRLYLSKNFGALPYLWSLVFIYFIIDEALKKGWDKDCSFGLAFICLIFIISKVRFKELMVDIKIPKKEYEELLTKYESDYELYQKDRQYYDNKIKTIKSEIDKLLELYNSDFNGASRKFYLNKLRPISEPIEHNQIIQRGKYDLHFMNKLNEYFPGKIKLDLIPTDHHNSYKPDIVYVDEETFLHIDIEIDEPYVLINKKPTHHIGYDDERDNFFMEMNWVVIRFTEKQIIEDLDECCKLINSVVKYVVNQAPINQEIRSENRWSKEEALSMAEQDYRKSYFPDNLSSINDL